MGQSGQMPRVVAAIDFGTYASGYAWMIVDPRITDPATQVIYHCRQWPGNVDPSAAKTRTALLTAGSAVCAHGSQAYKEYLQRRRGDAAERPVVIEDFKVALKAGVGGYRVHDDDLGLASLREGGMSVDDAVTDYLTWMVEQAVTDMRLSGVAVDEVEWCLTVPAIWEPEERDRTRQATRRAGIPPERLILALEPEAAAIHMFYMQQTMAGAGSAAEFDMYSPETRFMVVDGGGGTVDITGYEITSDRGLAQIGRATGERFGSQYLNRGFLDLFAARVGGSDKALALRRAAPIGFAEILSKWEIAKRDVEYAPTEPVEVPLGASIDRLMDDATRARLRQAQDGIDEAICLTPAELTGIFDAVVDPTLKYIDGQLAEMLASGPAPQARETILLAGGFAASPYLQEAVRRRFEGRARVIRAPLPETAVLMGAVQFARDPEITRSRTVNYTWGIATTTDYNPAVHDPSHRKKVAGKDACDGLFKVYVTDGQRVRADTPVVQTFTPFYDSRDDMSIKIFSSKDQDPRYVDDPGSECRGEIPVPIGNMMHLPRDERKVEVALYFGRTEIEAVAMNTLSGDKKRLTMKYSYRYSTTMGRS